MKPGSGGGDQELVLALAPQEHTQCLPGEPLLPAGNCLEASQNGSCMNYPEPEFGPPQPRASVCHLLLCTGVCMSLKGWKNKTRPGTGSGLLDGTRKAYGVYGVAFSQEVHAVPEWQLYKHTSASSRTC